MSTEVERSGSVIPAPAVAAPLDPLFRPAALAWRAFEQRARETGHPVHVRFALEQDGGAVSRFAIELMPDEPSGRGRELRGCSSVWSSWRSGRAAATASIWTRRPTLVEQLRAHFRDSPTGRFDSEIVGERVYGHPIEVVAAHELPPERSTTHELGGHLDGCRIGFDLGGSDRKVAAIIDGRVVWSEETEWDPYHQPDPQYHWDGIMDSLRRAADAPAARRRDRRQRRRRLRRQPGEVRVAVPGRARPTLFDRRVRNIFRDLKHAWHDVPFDVVNDGDVTALMGSMSLGGGGVLGIALGTSTAGGYVTADGRITPWLNEIAFVPIDYRAHAPARRVVGRRRLLRAVSVAAGGRPAAAGGGHRPSARRCRCPPSCTRCRR